MSYEKAIHCEESKDSDGQLIKLDIPAIEMTDELLKLNVEYPKVMNSVNAQPDGSKLLMTVEVEPCGLINIEWRLEKEILSSIDYPCNLHTLIDANYRIGIPGAVFGILAHFAKKLSTDGKIYLEEIQDDRPSNVWIKI